MSLSFDTLAAAKKYTDDSMAGAGAVAGVPCQIQSKTAITGGTRIIFLWVDNNGDSHTTTMDVMNGIDGQDGKGIQSVAVNAENHLIITYSDGTTSDAGEIEIHSAVDSVNGKTGAVVLDAEAVGALPANTPIPTKTSDLTNDSGFITKAVNDLVSYYLKSETYSKTQVDDIVTAIKNSRFEVVATLPTTDIKTNVIYLVPKNPTQTSNVKDEYINLDGTTSGWEKIGDTEIDLSDYVTTQALNTALAAYTTTADLTTLLAAKADKVSGATNGNFAGLDANGNLTDSGKKASDFATAQSLADEAATRSAMGAKNLFNNNMTSETIADEVTFTVNADKTVTAQITTTLTAGRNIHGTMTIPAGTYIYSGCPSGGSGSTYQMTFYSNTDQRNLATDRGEGAEFTIDKTHFVYVYLDLKVGLTPQTLLFKPMVRLATDANDTYRPYVPANKDLLSNKDNAILGARNILFHRGTYTTQGVRFESDDDGVITVTRQSASANHAYYNNGRFTLKPGTYIFSNGYDSLPSGIQATYLYNHTDGVYFTNCNNGPKTFTLTEEKRFAFNIEVQSSQSPSGVKIYPMIRLATDDDKTFSPITMTNKELTKIGTLKTITATVNSDFATDGTLLFPSVYIGGGYWLCAYQPIHIKAGIDINSLISGHANVITFPSGYTSGISVKAFHFVNGDTLKGMFQLANRWSSDGIQFYSIDSELNTYIKESSADIYMATPTSFIMLRETT